MKYCITVPQYDVNSSRKTKAKAKYKEKEFINYKKLLQYIFIHLLYNRNKLNQNKRRKTTANISLILSFEQC